MTHTPGPPKSCGLCNDGYYPRVGTTKYDFDSVICSLIGDDAICVADRLNPDCPKIERPKKQPTKAEIALELVVAKKINADLLAALEELLEIVLARSPEGFLSVYRLTTDKAKAAIAKARL